MLDLSKQTVIRITQSSPVVYAETGVDIAHINNSISSDITTISDYHGRCWLVTYAFANAYVDSWSSDDPSLFVDALAWHECSK